MIDTTFEKLGLHDEETKALMFLLENGEQTAGTLAKKTGISRPSLYGFLKNMRTIGLVIESQKNGVKTFSASSEEKILSIVNNRIHELENGKTDIKKVFSLLQKGGVARSPKFQIFEGKKGIQEAMRDMLLYQHMETKAYWPIKAMVKVLGEEFFSEFNRQRIRRNIYTRAIWPESERLDIKTHPFLGVGEKFLREIRVAPKEIDFEMGYWIYENKVVFLSSVKESFGFIVESMELVEMLSSQFEMIWKTSKTITVPKRYTDPFLKGV